MKFYLEGIHCLGCLWLLEKLSEIEPRISGSHLDFSHKILQVTRRDLSLPWEEVVYLLNRLGYTAQPLEKDSVEELRRRDLRRSLARLGVAAFCSGNVMLLSVSIYAGADAFFSRNFAWLSLALALPSLTYSAWPLYKSAFLPLRQGRLSADIAIALALLAGVLMSLWSLASGSSDGLFFDSLTMLVFLLLASRTLLSHFQERLTRESACLSLLSHESYGRISPKAGQTAAEELRESDRFEVRSGQTLPVDSRLLASEAHFDLSLLTGESEPRKFLHGDRIDAGAKLLSQSAAFECLSPAAESRLAKILEQIREFGTRRAPALDFADRLGRYFVVTVLALAALTWAIWPNAEGLRRALALVIVTCPCVLAFAVPLAFTGALRLAARRGILFRSGAKLEELARARTLFFDKTGTLTSGDYQVLRWLQHSGSELEAKAALFALEQGLSHPVAKAILRFVTPSPRMVASERREIPGRGVEGLVGGRAWSVKQCLDGCSPGENGIGIYEEGELRAQVVLGDTLRPEALAVVRELESRGIHTAILSGDAPANAKRVAEALGISEAHGGLLPEEKAATVARVPHAVMVGDGANDAVAFQGASVGIAMAGGMELSLRHADVLLTRPGLSGLSEAVTLSRRSLSLVRANFAITLTYNVIAGALAIAGIMQPLLAAVLMPMSALSVFALTEWQLRRGLR